MTSRPPISAPKKPTQTPGKTPEDQKQLLARIREAALRSDLSRWALELKEAQKLCANHPELGKIGPALLSEYNKEGLKLLADDLWGCFIPFELDSASIIIKNKLTKLRGELNSAMAKLAPAEVDGVAEVMRSKILGGVPDAAKKVVCDLVSLAALAKRHAKENQGRMGIPTVYEELDLGR